MLCDWYWLSVWLLLTAISGDSCVWGFLWGRVAWADNWVLCREWGWCLQVCLCVLLYVRLCGTCVNMCMWKEHVCSFIAIFLLLPTFTHTTPTPSPSFCSPSVWLVTPLISRLPQTVLGRVLKSAGNVLGQGQWWNPEKSQEKRRATRATR